MENFTKTSFGKANQSIARFLFKGKFLVTLSFILTLGLFNADKSYGTTQTYNMLLGNMNYVNASCGNGVYS